MKEWKRGRERGRSKRVANGPRESDVNGSEHRLIFSRVLQKAAERQTKRKE